MAGTSSQDIGPQKNETIATTLLLCTLSIHTALQRITLVAEPAKGETARAERVVSTLAALALVLVTALLALTRLASGSGGSGGGGGRLGRSCGGCSGSTRREGVVTRGLSVVSDGELQEAHK